MTERKQHRLTHAVMGLLALGISGQLLAAPAAASNVRNTPTAPPPAPTSGHMTWPTVNNWANPPKATVPFDATGVGHGCWWVPGVGAFISGAQSEGDTGTLQGYYRGDPGTGQSGQQEARQEAVSISSNNQRNAVFVVASPNPPPGPPSGDINWAALNPNGNATPRVTVPQNAIGLGAGRWYVPGPGALIVDAHTTGATGTLDGYYPNKAQAEQPPHHRAGLAARD